MINNSNTTRIKSAQKRNLGIFALIIGAGLMGLIYMLSDHTKNQTDIKAEKPNFVKPLENLDAESIVFEKTQKELRDAKSETDNLEQKLNTISDEKKMQDVTNQKSNEELVNRIAALEKQLTTTQTNPDTQNVSTSMSGSASYQGNFLSANGNSQEGQNNMGHSIREDKLVLSPNLLEADNTPLKNPDTYVPSGTFVQAVVIGGADASAAVDATANPKPMHFRIIAEGTLPNHKHSHLKDCFLTGAVVGDVSSERGAIRTESLSCVYANDEIVDQPVEGTIFGPDGKADLRGNLHDGTGGHVANAALSGIASGVSDGISKTYTTNSISADGNVSTTNPNKIFQNGIATGSAKGLDQVSKYEIHKAEQYHPIIQLSAGTVVDVVFLKGFFLDGKKHENKDASVGNYSENGTNSPSLFPNPSSDSQTLPLSPESVKRIQERSKELGLRVTTAPNSGSSV